MISRADKFPVRTKFYEWRKRAGLLRTPHLLIYTLSSSSPHAAVIIPKKIAKLSTTRNALRRILIDKVFQNAREAKVDAVVFVKATCSEADYLQELNNIK